MYTPSVEDLIYTLLLERVVYMIRLAQYLCYDSQVEILMDELNDIQ